MFDPREFSWLDFQLGYDSSTMVVLIVNLYWRFNVMLVCEYLSEGCKMICWPAIVAAYRLGTVCTWHQGQLHIGVQSSCVMNFEHRSISRALSYDGWQADRRLGCCQVARPWLYCSVFMVQRKLIRQWRWDVWCSRVRCRIYSDIDVAFFVHSPVQVWVTSAIIE